jgi:hypothetical protein
MFKADRPDILEPWTGKWIPAKREATMKIENSSITLDNCDGCRTGKKVPVITFYHWGEPVLTQCRSCAPAEFSRQSQRDKERWLSGE